jgi:hypothetical protein
MKQLEYHVRYLQRPALGTKYTEVVETVKALLNKHPLGPQTPLVVDKTGVGAAVVDLFTQGGIRPRAVTITGGNEVIRPGAYEIHIPKRELVSVLISLFQSGRD